MKYKDMTNDQIERVFAEDVLGWFVYTIEDEHDKTMDIWCIEDRNDMMIFPVSEDYYWSGTTTYPFHPLTDLNHAMLGVEKMRCPGRQFSLLIGHDRFAFIVGSLAGEEECCIEAGTPQAAIVEACIRIKRPDLFDGEKS